MFFEHTWKNSVLVPLLTNLLVPLSRTYIEEAESENSLIDIGGNETEIEIELEMQTWLSDGTLLTF